MLNSFFQIISGKPFSLVSAMDTSFAGFDFWGSRTHRRRKSDGDFRYGSPLSGRRAGATGGISEVRKVEGVPLAVPAERGPGGEPVNFDAVDLRRNRTKSMTDLSNAPELLRRSFVTRQIYEEEEKRRRELRRRKMRERREVAREEQFRERKSLYEGTRKEREERTRMEEDESTEEDDYEMEEEEEDEDGEAREREKEREREEKEKAKKGKWRFLDDVSSGADTDEDEADEKRDAFSFSKAASCALASKLAYESSPIIKYECKGWGFDRCDVVRFKNCKAYIASNSRMVLVVFAGTQPMNLR